MVQQNQALGKFVHDLCGSLRELANEVRPRAS